ncbi:MAG: hypothetical protein ACRDRO_26395 [Pseudonocardiaceae bacterium]
MEHTTEQKITILRRGYSASQPAMRGIVGDSTAGKTTLTTEPLNR